MLSVKEINLLQAQNEGLKKQNADLQRENAELKAENEQLKEEILKWQTAYSRQYQINENKGYNKKEEQYRQTLQEVKAIATECTTCGDCSNCKYNEDCDTDLTEQALGVCRMILEKITKAESEG